MPTNSKGDRPMAVPFARYSSLGSGFMLQKMTLMIKRLPAMRC